MSNRGIKGYVKAITRNAGEIMLDPQMISGHKSIDSMAGNFEIRVSSDFNSVNLSSHSSRSSLFEILRPMDVISIGIERPDGLMLGIVENIFETKSGGSTGQRLITIKGSDFGKILQQDNIVFAPLTVDLEGQVDKVNLFEAAVKQAFGNNHPLTRSLSATWGPITPMQTLGFENVDIQVAVDFVLKNGISLSVIPFFNQSANTPLGEIFRKEITSRPTDKVLLSANAAQYDGNIANFLKRLLDGPFYECWVDTFLDITQPLPVQPQPMPVLRIRPTPFDEENLNFVGTDYVIDPMFSWENLKTWITQEPYHRFQPEDLQNENLGISDYEALSFYTVNFTKEPIGTPFQELHGVSFPLLDIYMAKKYGLRPIRVSSQHLHVDPDIPTPQQIRNKRNQIFNWHRMNPEFLSGTVNILGRDDIRVGDRLAYFKLKKQEKDPILFYIKSLGFSWNVGQEYNMSLALTRGHSQKMVNNLKEEITTESALSNIPDMVEI